MRSPSDPPSRETSSRPERQAGREDRLKAALKANMARRKAQARARSADDATGDSERDEG